MTFLRQNSIGVKVWEIPFEELRWPMLTNLSMDPFERAEDEAPDYIDWSLNRMFLLGTAAGYVAQWLQSFPRIPAVPETGSFNLNRVMEAVPAADKNNN
jgi:hypothetical protein